MNPWRRVVAVVGVGRAKLAAVAVVALFATAGLASLGAQLLNSSTGAGITDYPTLARRAGDADLDGLPDVLENRLGSSPDRRDTLGHNVPDGWVYAWYRSATDWNDTTALDQPALVPPPDTLPQALREPGRLHLPSVAQLYAAEAAGRGEGTWWLDVPAVDPLQWDNDGDGIADAWLLQHGLRPWETKADQPAPGDSSYTLREKYEQGLDPSTPDTDHDGLSDRAEVSGRATFGSRQVDFTRTDPLLFSARGDGVPDGFVVRFGLDPHDDTVADRAPMPGGLTVREAFLETQRACRSNGTSCDWLARLSSGPLVDPTRWDSNDDGVPDAWVVRQSHGDLSPLDDAHKLVLSSTEAWDTKAWGGDPADPSVVVDDNNPLPKKPFLATLADYYARSRPAVWNETTMGPWWGGIPSDLDSPDGALPPAVALRGWNVTIDPCRGCRDEAARAEHRIPLAAASDPRLADSDGDGRSDLEEYLGWMGEQAGPRTNPFDSDTDGDGLSDAQETAGGLGTNPLRRDTSGGFLTDGEAYAYWNARYAKAVADLAASPASAAVTYGFLRSGSGLTTSDLERLKPEGMLDGTTPNLLNPDADGDGIANGAELLPNTYLDLPTTQERPATDPARADSDGDGLPDSWEVGWSRMRYFVDCPKTFCVGPNPSFQGWPLNPGRYDSFDPSATEVAHGAASDASRNLKGDQVKVAAGEPPRQFRNDLAYRYGLSPFNADTSPDDGIPDLFAIQWGIEALPAEVRLLADTNPQFAWVKEAGERLEGKRPPGAGTEAITHAAIDPSRTMQGINLTTNLRGMFFGREKGTWVVDPSTSCATTTLPPAGDPRAEAGYDVQVADRSLSASCWRWAPY
ncbi:MAG: thrombospondin type 3 repeat-containing protein, partial [Halobacteriales archaeon]|nr:thrombospondin type 3 repeat-containing protein [Halobacteriales archaeon]